ncbi:hypothetical protein QYE76_025390 [Lolium multiflorum]|uniref:DUF4220 domain-containing protein n=1 Tax=Lolium multiflorum TaxID=4521 RepID=A0AAD8RIH1_LOLMU|nr:hypothetical protein QYE76_025390 [Lolium multiflorum]
MAGGGTVQLWTDSGIQIVVVLSFTFQVFLFFFAGIRRRNASTVLNLLLWLVYLLADSTAIYALGHMSYTSPSGKHQLVAFWAPLLLVHLGGPDSITAYAVEDSRLWLRHLLTLVVQTLGAGYVLYTYVASASSTGSLILAASVLMFTVGVLKYGERTWALRCGTTGGIKSIRGLIQYSDSNSSMKEAVKKKLRNQKEDNEEELLILAHLLLSRCVDAFAVYPGWTQHGTSDLYPLQGDDMYKLIQMQLSLMYDIMYTKAWVIHTWCGYCIRAVSFVATLASMFLFSISNKNGYTRIDVDITYFLLVGAVVLEIMSVVATIGSTWMCAWLCSFERTTMLGTGLKFLRRLVGATSKRRWSSSIGQYNLFHFCTRDNTELGSRATYKLGLQNWWNRVHFVCTADFSNTHIQGLLLKNMIKLSPSHSTCIQILESNGLSKEEAGWSHWSLNLDFGKSILIWHLATDIYLIRSKEIGNQGDLAKAVRMLSNYMMFLLVTKPDMLPGFVEESWHNETRCRLERQWYNNRRNTELPPKKWLKKLFHNDGPDGSRNPQIEQLASTLRSGFLSDHDGKWEYTPPENRKAGSTRYEAANVHAKEHAAELLHLESRKPDLLEVIFGLWLERLVYAAHRCGPESHARQLTKGGEFITVVWVLSRHFGSSRRRD